MCAPIIILSIPLLTSGLPIKLTQIWCDFYSTVTLITYIIPTSDSERVIKSILKVFSPILLYRYNVYETNRKGLYHFHTFLRPHLRSNKWDHDKHRLFLTLLLSTDGTLTILFETKSMCYLIRLCYVSLLLIELYNNNTPEVLCQTSLGSLYPRYHTYTNKQGWFTVHLLTRGHTTITLYPGPPFTSVPPSRETYWTTDRTSSLIQNREHSVLNKSPLN